jgi:hypothetical protein
MLGLAQKKYVKIIVQVLSQVRTKLYQHFYNTESVFKKVF